MALQAALSLSEVEHVAVAIAEDLHFDVARSRNEPAHEGDDPASLLQNQRTIAEEPFGFVGAHFNHLANGVVVLHDAHSLHVNTLHRRDATASSVGRFENHGVANALYLFHQTLRRLVCIVVPRDHGDTTLHCELLRVSVHHHVARTEHFLELINCMDSGDGPMNLIECSRHSCENSGLSEIKP